MKFLEMSRFEFWTAVVCLGALIVLVNIFLFEHKTQDVRDLENRIDSLNLVVNDCKKDFTSLLQRNDTISIVINNYPLNTVKKK